MALPRKVGRRPISRRPIIRFDTKQYRRLSDALQALTICSLKNFLVLYSSVFFQPKYCHHTPRLPFDLFAYIFKFHASTSSRLKPCIHSVFSCALASMGQPGSQQPRRKKGSHFDCNERRGSALFGFASLGSVLEGFNPFSSSQYKKPSRSRWCTENGEWSLPR